MSGLPDELADAIAIVGMACRFPDAADPDAFWRNLVEGRESVRRFDREALLHAGERPEVVDAPDYVPAGLVLEGHDCFDAAFFGLSPREARVMDPQHRKFLECAWNALEDSGHTPADVGRNIGVFAGSGMHWYLLRNVLGHAALVREMGEFLVRHTANDKDFLATRVSFHLDIRGPGINVQTACSTSLVALHLACQSLLARECDMALAGGSTIEVPHGVGYVWREEEIRSADGHCRPFDADSGGTIFGSGCGVVVLRRLADALADGDHIRAVVRGTAVNNDGAGKAGYLAPSVDGQAQCIAEAIGVAGVDASTIGYVEAHGTATRIGDPIEVAALTQAFGDVPRNRCGIGSLKANIGHLDSAAGIAGVIKLALALERGKLPPSLNFRAPNPEIDFAASPFRVVDRLGDWPDLGAPRRAGVSSLGVGGTNAHAVLEQAPPRAARPAEPAPARCVLVVSARTADAAMAAAGRLADHLVAASPALGDVAFTLREGRVAFEHRIAVAAADPSTAAASLRAARPVAASPSAPALVFMFPGQGSQYPGMGRAVARLDADCRAALDRCFAILRRLGREDVVAALGAEPGDAAAAAVLRETRVTQPALFCVEYALACALRAKGLRPAAMIGHSLGEYVAACLAGVFELDAAIELVCRRGELIAALPPGRMIAVPLSQDALRPLLDGALSLAAANAPEVSVCSGPAEAIAALEARLRELGHAARPLETSHAFHSAMLDPILARFRDAVVAARPRAELTVRIASNLDGSWLTPARAASPDYWVEHLRHSVQFAAGIERLRELGPSVLVEVGPGRTLATFAGACVPGARAAGSLPHPRDAAGEAEVYFGLPGALWSHGAAPDWAAWGQPRRGQRLPLPTYPFEARRHWLDPVAREAQAAPSAGATRRAAERWFQCVDWRSVAPPVAAAARPRVLLLADGQGLGGALGDALRARGAAVESIPPSSDAATLESRLAAVAPGVAQVVYAWPLDVSGQDPRAARAVCFDRLLQLAQRIEALAGDAPALELVVLSADAHGVGGASGVDPAQSLVAGVVRTIDREFGSVRARWIDLDAQALRETASAAGRIADELCATEPPALVAWRGRRRFVPQFVDLPLATPAATPFRRGGTYLITGAFGGAGRALARHLATHHAARLVLVSRRPLPEAGERESRLAALPPGDPQRGAIQWLRRLERSGATVEAIAADAADGDGLLAAVRARGIERLDGVFHAAGVLDDGPIATKALASAHRVLHPKLDGVLGLQRLLALEPAFVAYFSSISALAGAAGQVDYTAANAFVDAFAQAADAGAGATRHVAFGLGMLRDAGMAHALAVAAGVAVGLPADAEPVDHPLLEARTGDASSRWAYHAVLGADTCWMLDQHRLRSGAAILPGTAYLDLIAAAWRDGGGGAPWRIEDVMFRAPLLLEGRQRCLLEIAFERRDADAVGVLVSSRTAGSGEPTEHLTAVLRGHAPAVAALPPASALVPVPAAYRHPGLVFGPYWNCLHSIQAAAQDARLELELPDDATLDGHPLHAALLDMAVGAAQGVLGATLDVERLVPARYAVVDVHDALPRRVSSRVHARIVGEALHLDVDLEDATGRVLVRVRDLVLRPARIAGAAPAAAAAGVARNAVLAAGYEDALSEAELLLAIERVLGQPTPAAIAVATRGLDELIAAARADAAAAEPVAGEAAHRAPRPGLATPHASPADGAERAIAAAWEAMLEIDGIGADDNFFELGGHSLLLTRLLSRLRREHRIDIPLEPAFEAPTIRAWAAAAACSDAAPAKAPIRRIERSKVRIPASDAPR